MSDEHTKIIEINGIKLEVDLRNAKVVENYKVGDRIKVLKKKYSDSYVVRYGVIVDFGLCKERPSIEILSVPSDACFYADDTLAFDVINQDSTDIEIAPLSDLDETFARDNIVKAIEGKIETTRHELRTLELKKELFLRHFGKYFGEVKKG